MIKTIDKKRSFEGAESQVVPRRLRQKTCVPRNETIAQQRIAHTVVTSIWADGSPGPLTFVFPEKGISQALLDELNREFVGEAFCMTSGAAGMSLH